MAAGHGQISYYRFVCNEEDDDVFNADYVATTSPISADVDVTDANHQPPAGRDNDIFRFVERPVVDDAPPPPTDALTGSGSNLPDVDPPAVDRRPNSTVISRSTTGHLDVDALSRRLETTGVSLAAAAPMVSGSVVGRKSRRRPPQSGAAGTRDRPAPISSAARRIRDFVDVRFRRRRDVDAAEIGRDDVRAADVTGFDGGDADAATHDVSAGPARGTFQIDSIEMTLDEDDNDEDVMFDISSQHYRNDDVLNIVPVQHSTSETRNKFTWSRQLRNLVSNHRKLFVGVIVSVCLVLLGLVAVIMYILIWAKTT